MCFCFCVLGDIEPTDNQRECSCSQLTPLSTLFTGVNEGGSQCRSGKRALMLTQKRTYDRAALEQMSERLTERRREASATEMLQKPERGGGAVPQ